MKKIVIKDNFALIYFPQSFYSKKIIIDTLETYKEILKGQVGEIGKYFVTKIEPITNDYSIKLLCKEYSNYILSQEKEKIKKK